MTSQSSYTSSKRMSSSAIVRPRLGKNDPQNMRPKPDYAAKRGRRRPQAADRLTERTDKTPVVSSAAGWSVKSFKERFLNSSCCLLRRPPTHPRPPPQKNNRCVAVGESAQWELNNNPVWSSSVPPRLSHRFPVSFFYRYSRLQKQTIRGGLTNMIVNFSAAVSPPWSASTFTLLLKLCL